MSRSHSPSPSDLGNDGPAIDDGHRQDPPEGRGNGSDAGGGQSGDGDALPAAQVPTDADAIGATLGLTHKQVADNALIAAGASNPQTVMDAARGTNAAPAPTNPLEQQVALWTSRVKALETDFDNVKGWAGVIPGAMPIVTRVSQLEAGINTALEFINDIAPLMDKLRGMLKEAGAL